MKRCPNVLSCAFCDFYGEECVCLWFLMLLLFPHTLLFRGESSDDGLVTLLPDICFSFCPSPPLLTHRATLRLKCFRWTPPLPSSHDGALLGWPGPGSSRKIERVHVKVKARRLERKKKKKRKKPINICAHFKSHKIQIKTSTAALLWKRQSNDSTFSFPEILVRSNTQWCFYLPHHLLAL